jgi:hypothetical protein
LAAERTTHPEVNVLQKVLALGLAALGCCAAWATTTANDGDWSLKTVTLSNTPEANLMVRVGDIDNLGFGWPSGFDPFSGRSTPAHGYPFTAGATDPDGTDRIMVISSYAGKPPHGADGYTASTARPANTVRTITLSYDLSGINLQGAALQMFVDDFQAPVWASRYQAKLNGQRVPELELVLNSLDQTGPIGKLINFTIPVNYLSLLQSGTLEIAIDDPTSGAGDGYAIDFIKLLINPNTGAAQTGSLQGTVTDASNGAPVAHVAILVNNEFQAVTDGAGRYTVASAVSGLAVVQTMKSGYAASTKAVDVITGQAATGNFVLQRSTSGTAPVSTAACVATLSANLTELFIPCLDYQSAAGPVNFWLGLTGATGPSGFVFGLRQYGTQYQIP